MDMIDQTHPRTERSLPRRSRPFVFALGVIAAVAAATAAAPAMAQVAALPPPGDGGARAAPAVTSWDVNLYLQNSERANLETALERASQAPLGGSVTWVDSTTHASGEIRPLRDVAGPGGQTCRSYNVTVDVPRRTSGAWMTNMGTHESNTAQYAQESLSPAFTRRFTTDICSQTDGALVPAQHG
jgi:hypothetical protein